MIQGRIVGSGSKHTKKMKHSIAETSHSQISVSHGFNLPFYFRHIYRNSATVCPLPHTDPQHRPKSLRSRYLATAARATFLPPSEHLPGRTSPCCVIHQHHLPTLPCCFALEKAATRHLGEGHRLPPVALEKAPTRRPGEDLPPAT
jgi:hypothetical protein